VDLDLPVSANSVHLIARLGRERGLNPAELLRGTGITPELLQGPLAEVALRQEYAVLRNLIGHPALEPGFGVVLGASYHLGMHGVWGLLIATGRTLRDALAIALGYLDVSWAFTKVELAESDGIAMLRSDGSDIPDDVRPFLIERISGAGKVLLRDVFGAEVPLRAVHYTHPAPANTDRYLEVLGVKPSFGAGDNSIRFDADILDVPLHRGNEWTRRGYEAVCQGILAKHRARSGVAGSVRDLLVREPGRIPDVVTVAKELNVSPRTLFRHLELEGTSFRVLVDEVRAALAEEMLSVAGLNTEDVADRLGYSDPASFVRAFKRWKGQTPQAFRLLANRPGLPLRFR
jgi:AraC-like DNA-binding protein